MLPIATEISIKIILLKFELQILVRILSNKKSANNSR